jgi:hypothetical protein
MTLGVLLLPGCGDFSEGPVEDAAVAEEALNLTFAQHQAACQADPSTNSQPGNAPCFNPALRTPAP